MQGSFSLLSKRVRVLPLKESRIVWIRIKGGNSALHSWSWTENVFSVLFFYDKGARRLKMRVHSTYILTTEDAAAAADDEDEICRELCL